MLGSDRVASFLALKSALLVTLGLVFVAGCGADVPVASAPPATAGAATNDAPAAADATAVDERSAPSDAGTQTPGAQTPAETPAEATANATPRSNSSPKAKPTAAQLESWALSTEAPLSLLACYDGFDDSFLQCLAVSPDGKQFVVGGEKLTVWNANGEQPVADLLADIDNADIERPILCVAISPDGKWIAAGDNGGMLRMWTLGDRQPAASFEAHDGRLTQLAFSPEGSMLATTSYGGEVKVWQTSDGKNVTSIKVDDQEIHGLAFLSEQRLVCAGRETGIWDIDSGEKIETLTSDRVIRPVLALSPDRRQIAFTDADSQIQLWDVENGKPIEHGLRGPGAGLIAFSSDGRRIATFAGDATIRLWDAETRRVSQVIDADGDRTSALAWLPESGVLVVASERGRLRLWGTADAATALGIEPLSLPMPEKLADGSRTPLNPAQLQQIIDVRSFARLPDAASLWGLAGMDSYNTAASQAEIELFYRHVLGQAGWTEIEEEDPAQPGLNFQKEGCRLNVSILPASTPVPGREGGLDVNVRFAGNYDANWLPQIAAIKSPATFKSFSHVMYRTKQDLTALEVELLKKFHEAGWTPYTRLNASSSEDPRMRLISMLQGGSELNVMIGYPADSNDELVVQTTVGITSKALPIPEDAGWIEFDASTDLQMVAATRRDLNQTVEYYDTQMAREGWLSREAGRHIEEDKAWLPFIRGQQDVLIRLVAMPEGKTRIIVGEAEQTSWQLKAPPADDEPQDQNGIEAADFPLPKNATAVKYDVDAQTIEFEIAGKTPPQVGELFVEPLADQQWTRSDSGVVSDEYVLMTFTRGDEEIDLRVRAQNGKTTGQIGGDGVLWTKPLPTPPVRVSYETWLRRNKKEASLDHLDEFAAEMEKIKG